MRCRAFRTILCCAALFVAHASAGPVAGGAFTEEEEAPALTAPASGQRRDGAAVFTDTRFAAAHAQPHCSGDAALVTMEVFYWKEAAAGGFAAQGGVVTATHPSCLSVALAVGDTPLPAATSAGTQSLMATSATLGSASAAAAWQGGVTLTVTGCCEEAPTVTLALVQPQPQQYDGAPVRKQATSASKTPTPSKSPSKTMTPTKTPSKSVTASRTPSPASLTATPSPTASRTPTVTATPSPASLSPSRTISVSPAPSTTTSLSPSHTESPSYSVTPTVSRTVSATCTFSPTYSPTHSPSPTASDTESSSASDTATRSSSGTVTGTRSASRTVSATPSFTSSSGSSRTPTVSATVTSSLTMTISGTTSCTGSVSATTSLTETTSSTASPTPSATDTRTQSGTPTSTPSRSSTCSPTASHSASTTTSESPSPSDSQGSAQAQAGACACTCAATRCCAANVNVADLCASPSGLSLAMKLVIVLVCIVGAALCVALSTCFIISRRRKLAKAGASAVPLPSAAASSLALAGLQGAGGYGMATWGSAASSLSRHAGSAPGRFTPRALPHRASTNTRTLAAGISSSDSEEAWEDVSSGDTPTHIRPVSPTINIQLTQSPTGQWRAVAGPSPLPTHSEGMRSAMSPYRHRSGRVGRSHRRGYRRRSSDSAISPVGIVPPGLSSLPGSWLPPRPHSPSTPQRAPSPSHTADRGLVRTPSPPQPQGQEGGGKRTRRHKRIRLRSIRRHVSRSSRAASPRRDAVHDFGQEASFV